MAIWFLLIVGAPAALELVKDAVVLVQDAQLVAQVVMHTVCLHGSVLHVQVPDLDMQVVSGAQVASGVTELDVRYAADDLREEVLCCGILSLFEYFKVNSFQRMKVIR